MGAGHADHAAVMGHDHAPGLRTGKNGDAGRPGGLDLRIGVWNGGGADHQTGSRRIFTVVADGDGDARLTKLLRVAGSVPVASADPGAHVLQHTGQSPHGDAADADQMDRALLPDICFKLLIVHNRCLPRACGSFALPAPPQRAAGASRKHGFRCLGQLSLS